MTLGGTYDVGESSLDVDPDVREDILIECIEVEPALRVSRYYHSSRSTCCSDEHVTDALWEIHVITEDACMPTVMYHISVGCRSTVRLVWTEAR